jgi:hypothetical protein
LNMLHDITSNFKKNKFVIVLDFELFYFNIINKKKRMMRNMIDNDFINDSNELSDEIDCFHENCHHTHQAQKSHEDDHIFELFDKKQLIVIEE